MGGRRRSPESGILLSEDASSIHRAEIVVDGAGCSVRTRRWQHDLLSPRTACTACRDRLVRTEEQ